MMNHQALLNSVASQHLVSVAPWQVWALQVTLCLGLKPTVSYMHTHVVQQLKKGKFH